MRIHQTRSIMSMSLPAAMLATALLTLGGCQNDGKPHASDSAGARPADKQPPAQPASNAHAATTPPPPAQQAEPKPAPAQPAHTYAPEMAQPVVAETDDERREQTANVIYAQIRLRMEEFIAERRQLLSSGKTRDDLPVRELEARILKARELLMEAGEMVEDVDPPM